MSAEIRSNLHLQYDSVRTSVSCLIIHFHIFMQSILKKLFILLVSERKHKEKYQQFETINYILLSTLHYISFCHKHNTVRTLSRVRTNYIHTRCSILIDNSRRSRTSWAEDDRRKNRSNFTFCVRWLSVRGIFSWCIPRISQL